MQRQGLPVPVHGALRCRSFSLCAHLMKPRVRAPCAPARQGMNVARMNMSHGDHKSHKAVVDLVKEYNTLGRGNVALMLDTKGPEVRSGDLSEPIDMKAGAPPAPSASPYTVPYPSPVPGDVELASIC